MPNSVKVFQSTDSGAPALSGTAGTLIAVLDACLTSGYGTVTIDTLVVASDVATVTDSSGHGFTAIGTVGPVIRIAGATPAGLNGDWRITYVSATQFTFATAGISDQTASGTITATRAPAGFSKVFSGTNLAAYRSDDITGTRLYLRVDDSPAQYPTMIMYEAMTDVNTGTGLAPTTGSYFAAKSTAANSTARPWRLYSDTKAFYLFMNADGSTWKPGLFFGDINSYKSGDAYHCGLIAGATNADYNNLYLLTSTTGSLLSRSYTQTGAAVLSARYSHGKTGSQLGGAAGNAYPNPADNGFHGWPIEVWEGTTIARGMMPGCWNPIHLSANLDDGTIISDLTGLAGRTVLVQQLGSATQRCAVDISGPWR